MSSGLVLPFENGIVAGWQHPRYVGYNHNDTSNFLSIKDRSNYVLIHPLYISIHGDSGFRVAYFSLFQLFTSVQKWVEYLMLVKQAMTITANEALIFLSSCRHVHSIYNSLSWLIHKLRKELMVLPGSANSLDRCHFTIGNHYNCL